MSLSFLGSRRAEFALLSLCAAACLLSLGAYYVGFFNDDAFYIIGARSLLHGRFAELNAPSQPPLNPYMPGYPLLLAPLAALFPATFLPMQLLSVLFTLGSLHLLWELLADRAEPEVRFAAVALAGLNPLAVSVSGTVLTDPLFVFLTLALFVQVRRAWPREEAGPWVGLCALCAAAYYVRPTGAVFGAAVVAALLLEKRPRQALHCALLLAAFCLPWSLRNILLSGHALPYARELPTGDPSPALGRAFADCSTSAFFHLRELYARAFFRWPGARPGGAAETLTQIAGIVLTLLGALRWRPRAFALLAAAAYAGLHLFWAKTTARYLLPALPFAAALLFVGLRALEERLRAPRSLLVLSSLVLALGLCAPTLGAVFSAARRKGTPLTSPPERTFAWVRASTPPEAVFAAEAHGRLHLLTGRRSVRLRGASDPRAFAQALRTQGADWVLAMPDDHPIVRPGPDPNAPLPHAELERLAAPPLFERVFTDPAERSAVYRLK